MSFFSYASLHSLTLFNFWVLIMPSVVLCLASLYINICVGYVLCGYDCFTMSCDVILSSKLPFLFLGTYYGFCDVTLTQFFTLRLRWICHLGIHLFYYVARGFWSHVICVSNFGYLLWLLWRNDDVVLYCVFMLTICPTDTCALICCATFCTLLKIITFGITTSAIQITSLCAVMYQSLSRASLNFI